METIKVILEGDVFLIWDKAVSCWILDFVDDTITLEKEYNKGPPSHGESKSNDFQGDGYVSEDRENSMVDEELNIPINQSNFAHPEASNFTIGQTCVRSPVAVARQGPSPSVDGATSLANLFGKEDIESDHVTTGSFLGSKGFLRGILCVWDPTKFIIYRILSTTNSVIVDGMWVLTGYSLMIISVYDPPQGVGERRALWDYFSNAIPRWRDEVIALGDFNEDLPSTHFHNSTINRGQCHSISAHLFSLPLTLYFEVVAP
ncbi:unnamed protein product [Lactuca saligna]|uniref:RNA-directed DNA polymerase, eukaryota n=1 Tax=Lactuca saligna TaxID=75948 RepID=A0AA36EJZ6_LACSI|nr:unnamed protein product [Lactuca saligna]